jgi:membrane protease subunit (stomatin/prohibitin family)
MRNETAMMADPSLMSAYMQKSVADGIKAAGGNAGGAAIGFMGFNAAQSAGAGILGAMPQVQQPAPKAEPSPHYAANQQPPVNAPSGSWKCSCGAVNTGNFCQNCGGKKPEVTVGADGGKWFCSDCGTPNTAKFCQNCGKPKQ